MSLSAAELADLDARCFPVGERWSEGLWADELSADRHLGEVREASRLVGAITVSSLFEDAELLRVMVDPEHRGRGHARHLVTESMDAVTARGATRMLLEVRHDNEPAIALYRGLGFAEIDRRRDYYGTGVHALVMECGLGGSHD